MCSAYAGKEKNSIILFMLLTMRDLIAIYRESWVRFTENTQFTRLSMKHSCTCTRGQNYVDGIHFFIEKSIIKLIFVLYGLH